MLSVLCKLPLRRKSWKLSRCCLVGGWATPQVKLGNPVPLLFEVNKTQPKKLRETTTSALLVGNAIFTVLHAHIFKKMHQWLRWCALYVTSRHQTGFFCICPPFKHHKNKHVDYHHFMHLKVIFFKPPKKKDKNWHTQWKLDGWKMKFPFGARPIFTTYVSWHSQLPPPEIMVS